MLNFFQLRNLENEFLDFKPFYIDSQFREIYSDLNHAYKRGDRVILQRSLSEGMFQVLFDSLTLILVHINIIEREET